MADREEPRQPFVMSAIRREQKGSTAVLKGHRGSAISLVSRLLPKLPGSTERPIRIRDAEAAGTNSASRLTQGVDGSVPSRGPVRSNWGTYAGERERAW